MSQASIVHQFKAIFFQNPYVVLTIAPLGWAANTIASRMAVGEVPPMTLTFFRWFSVVLLMLVFARKDIIAHRKVMLQSWTYVLTMGVLAFTIFNSLYYVAAHFTTAVNIGLLQGAIPALVFIVAFLGRGARATPPQIIGAILTLIGIGVIAAKGSLETLLTLQFNIGDILMLVACIAWAFYTVGLPAKPNVSPLAFFMGLAMAAAVTTFPLWLGEIALGQFFWPTAKGWWIIAGITLVPSILSQLMFVRGVELIGPGRAGLFVNLIPVFASGLAVLILDEPFHLYHAVALGLVLGGIALAEWTKLARNGS